MTDVEINVGEIPESWSDEDERRIREQLESIARGVKRQRENGKTPEEIVGGWKAYMEQNDVEGVDFDYRDGSFRISFGEKA